MLTTTTLNGVNLEALTATIGAVQQDSTLAAFQFRAANRWMNGGHNRSTIGGFYGTAREIDGEREFTLDADEPPLLLGGDKGANPAEYVLHALAACLTTSVVYHAAARGWAIDSIESRLEGDVDVRGFLGLSNAVPKGYQAIRVAFRIRSEVPVEKLQALCQFSPVYDMISRAVPVTVSIEKA
jgi:uncharacterized OsmC-like protein